MCRARAFTYVELTMVCAIIAILASIAIPNFLEAQVRAKVSRAKADMAVVTMALDAYRMETKSYPLNKIPGEANPYDLVALTTPVPYLTCLPHDPFTMNKRLRDTNQAVAPVPFNYFNALQVNREAGLIVKGPNLLGPRSFIAGLVWGRGPDTYGPGTEPRPATVISKTGEATLLVYDPTNGTKSSGDIYVRFP
jgi:type II secretory pathway pseudopilin PulG